MTSCSSSPSRVALALALGWLGLAASPASAQLAADQPPPPEAGVAPPEVSLADEYPRIELVTMGIGSLIWEKHGHIAICVHLRPGQARCYNYGVANFRQPVSMFMSFLRGEPSFWVAATSPERLYVTYRNADRTIFIQRLPLTRDEKRAIIKKLAFDVKKENRYYSYDHFHDNCTTRVRDIIDDATGGRLSKMKAPEPPHTFRDYARAGFTGLPWALLVTDLAMGRSTDVKPTHYEAMFLPDYLRDAVTAEFGVEPVIEYPRQGPPHPTEGSSGRMMLFFIIIALTAPAWGTRLWGRYQRIGLGVAVVLPSIIGLVLWFGVVVSPVPYVRFNELALVFCPLDLAMPFLGARKLSLYCRGRVAIILLVSLLLAIGVFRQPVWVFLLWPLIPLGSVILPELLASRRLAKAPSTGALGEEESSGGT